MGIFKTSFCAIGLILSSCSHPFTLDKCGEEQLKACASACYVSTSIRDNYEEKYVFRKIVFIINDIFRERDFSRSHFVLKMQRNLTEFPEPVRNKVIAETLRIYDYHAGKDREVWALKMTQESILLNFQSKFFSELI